MDSQSPQTTKEARNLRLGVGEVAVLGVDHLDRAGRLGLTLELERGPLLDHHLLLLAAVRNGVRDLREMDGMVSRVNPCLVQLSTQAYTNAAGRDTRTFRLFCTPGAGSMLPIAFAPTFTLSVPPCFGDDDGLHWHQPLCFANSIPSRNKRFRARDPSPAHVYAPSWGRPSRPP